MHRTSSIISLLFLICGTSITKSQVAEIPFPSEERAIKEVKAIFSKDYYKKKHGYSSVDKLVIKNIGASDYYSDEVKPVKHKYPRDRSNFEFSVTTPKDASGAYYEYSAQIEYTRSNYNGKKFFFYDKWSIGYKQVKIFAMHGIKEPAKDDMEASFLAHYEKGQIEAGAENIIRVSTPEFHEAIDYWDSRSSKQRNYKTGFINETTYHAYVSIITRKADFNREGSGISKIGEEKEFFQIKFKKEGGKFTIADVTFLTYENLGDIYKSENSSKFFYDTLYTNMTDGGLKAVYNRTTPRPVPLESDRIHEERYKGFRAALEKLTGEPGNDKKLLAGYFNPEKPELVDETVKSFQLLKSNLMTWEIKGRSIYAGDKKYDLKIHVKRSGQSGKYKKPIDGYISAKLDWLPVDHNIYLDNTFTTDKLDVKWVK